MGWLLLPDAGCPHLCLSASAFANSAVAALVADIDGVIACMVGKQ